MEIFRWFYYIHIFIEYIYIYIQGNMRQRQKIDSIFMLFLKKKKTILKSQWTTLRARSEKKQNKKE